MVALKAPYLVEGVGRVGPLIEHPQKHGNCSLFLKVKICYLKMHLFCLSVIFNQQLFYNRRGGF
ncbi:MAG: hypothetical protein C0402_05190 [Thermodesulfovibrio sp.]|nr:hypothetical protein [Thermodesulfovibrio sp.]